MQALRSLTTFPHGRQKQRRRLSLYPNLLYEGLKGLGNLPLRPRP
jgi:hypothetical protein